jgi:hypothetical protein
MPYLLLHKQWPHLMLGPSWSHPLLPHHPPPTSLPAAALPCYSGVTLHLLQSFSEMEGLSEKSLEGRVRVMPCSPLPPLLRPLSSHGLSTEGPVHVPGPGAVGNGGCLTHLLCPRLRLLTGQRGRGWQPVALDEAAGSPAPWLMGQSCASWVHRQGGWHCCGVLGLVEVCAAKVSACKQLQHG